MAVMCMLCVPLAYLLLCMCIINRATADLFFTLWISYALALLALLKCSLHVYAVFFHCGMLNEYQMK